MQAVPGQGTLTYVGRSARDWDSVGLAGTGLRFARRGRGADGWGTLLC